MVGVRSCALNGEERDRRENRNSTQELRIPVGWGAHLIQAASAQCD